MVTQLTSGTRTPDNREAPGRRRRRHRLMPWGLALPGLVFVAVLLVYPALEVIVSSFFSQTGRSIYQREFTGFDHFTRLLNDDDVIATFWRTVVWVVVVTVASYLIGLAIALLLHRRFVGRGVVRSVVLIPWAVPFVAAAFAWENIYDNRYGILNHALSSVGVVDEPVAWLGSPSTAFWSVIAVAVWKQVPFVAVTLLAGLQSIDNDYYEAASIDGAGAIRKFQSITFPAIVGVSTIVIGFTTIWTYNQFDLIYLMTGGGPANSSQIVSVFTYLSAFTFGSPNYAAAIGTTALVVLALLLIPIARIVARRSA